MTNGNDLRKRDKGHNIAPDLQQVQAIAVKINIHRT